MDFLATDRGMARQAHTMVQNMDTCQGNLQGVKILPEGTSDQEA